VMFSRTQMTGNFRRIIRMKKSLMASAIIMGTPFVLNLIT